MVQSYDGRFICNNCSWRGVIQIEKGTTLEEAREIATCPNCGCEDTLEILR